MCDTCGWRESIKQANELIERAEDLPSRAEEFGDSVTEKLKSIVEWMEEFGHVTPKQQEAIDNIEGGIERWNV
jgi:methyl-accepting chemotaxis protein